MLGCRHGGHCWDPKLDWELVDIKGAMRPFILAHEVAHDSFRFSEFRSRFVQNSNFEQLLCNRYPRTLFKHSLSHVAENFVATFRVGALLYWCRPTRMVGRSKIIQSQAKGFTLISINCFLFQLWWSLAILIVIIDSSWDSLAIIQDSASAEIPTAALPQLAQRRRHSHPHPVVQVKLTVVWLNNPLIGSHLGLRIEVTGFP